MMNVTSTLLRKSESILRNSPANRRLGNKFLLVEKKTLTSLNSFVINAFCGRIESKQIFPYPDILSKEQRETLKSIVKPVEQFFYEIGSSREASDKSYSNESALKRLWELGAFSLQIPKDLGGLGLCNTQYARLVEIVGAHDLGVGITLGAHQSLGYKGILLYGTEKQKKTYLPKLSNGQFAAFCLTEPMSGSDMGSMTTTAELTPDGKNYVLNGSKLWIAATKADSADVMTVFAKTSSVATPLAKPWENVTAFLVEKSYVGITSALHHQQTKDEENTAKTVEVRFKNVSVPVENVLGDVGDGYKVAMTVLNNGRFGMVASLAGTMRSCTNKAVNFVNTQSLFGEKMYTFAAIKEKLSRMALLQYVTESMAYVISSNMDKGSVNCSLEAAISKCFASQAAWDVCDEAIEIIGGVGYLKEAELERIQKDLRTFRIFEGTNDVLRLYIALTGIQYAKPPIEELKRALKSPTERYEYIFKEISNKVFSMTGLNTFLKLNKGCHSHLMFPAYMLGRSIDSFSLGITFAIVTHGKNLETQQFLLNKISDCAIDIYSSACVLSRANNSIIQHLPTARYETVMANVWIREATKRIMGNVRDIIYKRQSAYFKNLSEISRKICETGKIPTNNPLNL